MFFKIAISKLSSHLPGVSELRTFIFSISPSMLVNPGGPGLYQSPLQDAYSYFADRNPLDPSTLGKTSDL